MSTFEFWLELTWLRAKCKGKTLLVIEIFFTFFNTALSQFSIVAQYPKKNMNKFSQQPCWMGAKSNFITTAGSWLDLEGRKYGPLDFINVAAKNELLSGI